ncbi:hypothetical protein BGY98DRAFT_267665 [Russula aff. rugulosa BPL654]|nr:hypothetical protein BGY98DRAFT_267665 [Russula aff. rugulosa BPL654]
MSHCDQLRCSNLLFLTLTSIVSLRVLTRKSCKSTIFSLTATCGTTAPLFLKKNLYVRRSDGTRIFTASTGSVLLVPSHVFGGRFPPS